MSSWLVITWLANLAVILGVVLEEYDFVRSAREYRRAHGWKELLLKIREKGWRKSLAHIGFAILVVGLAFELISQAKVEMDSAAEKLHPRWPRNFT